MTGFDSQLIHAPHVHNYVGAEVAEDIRCRVQSETKLTCSIGIGPNGMLAKVASDINKPNGQYVLPQDPAALKQFVQSLSLRKVPGIGKVKDSPLWYIITTMRHRVAALCVEGLCALQAVDTYIQ